LIDERRDPEKSTFAAAKYLRDSSIKFGHWYLAAGRLHAGERRVERAIEKHNTNDFWEL
jgi:membrane-bound lytic murein transglycosylase D